MGVFLNLYFLYDDIAFAGTSAGLYKSLRR
jgi:hypothetical protein